MQVFISHANKDVNLARTLAENLAQQGFKVWNAEDQIMPGENWAKKVGKALDDSDLMVILLSPRAMESDWLRQEIEFALGSTRYEGRVFSVFVGPTSDAVKGMPWILRRLAYRQVESAKDLGKVAKEIKAHAANSNLSHTNA
jgi:hypothetical protein